MLLKELSPGTKGTIVGYDKPPLVEGDARDLRNP